MGSKLSDSRRKSTERQFMPSLSVGVEGTRMYTRYSPPFESGAPRLETYATTDNLAKELIGGLRELPKHASMNVASYAQPKDP